MRERLNTDWRGWDGVGGGSEAFVIYFEPHRRIFPFLLAGVNLEIHTLHLWLPAQKSETFYDPV